jgi:hypothetical protein
MEAQFTCHRCRSLLGIPARDLGKRVQCPACHARFTVIGEASPVAEAAAPRQGGRAAPSTASKPIRRPVPRTPPPLPSAPPRTSTQPSLIIAGRRPTAWALLFGLVGTVVSILLALAAQDDVVFWISMVSLVVSLSAMLWGWLRGWRQDRLVFFEDRVQWLQGADAIRGQLPYDNILRLRPGWRSQHNHEVEVVEITLVSQGRADTWWRKRWSDLFEKPDILLWNDWEQETPLIRTTLEERVDRYWRDRNPDLDPRDKNEKFEVQATYARRRRWRWYGFLGGVVVMVVVILWTILQLPVDPDEEWQRVAPAGEGFSVLMPALPERDVRQEAGPLGMGAKVRYLASAGDRRYTVAFMERGRVNMANEQVFQNWRKDVLAKHPGRLRLEKRLLFDKHEAAEIVVDPRQGERLIERVHVTGDRLFFLRAEGPLRLKDAEANKFLDSFQIK